ncbi:MAG: metal-sensitive transcriptional regulator [Candidatus Tectomicrobia bacterium]|nr:metal-sensitive transcriptional regulator [Candidatus Tectomicrobia bacterium]
MTPAPATGVIADRGAQSDVIMRLKRIEGQLRGIQQMVATERYCMEVLAQLRSAAAAIGKVEELLLRRHLLTCVAEALRSGGSEAQRDKVEEILVLLRQPGLRP